MEANPALEVCLQNLMQAEKLSLRGVLDLSTSVVVAAQMRTAKDKNAALQGATIEARWLQTDLADAKAEAEKTISRCQQFPNVVSIGQNLVTALEASSDAAGVIVAKTQDVRIDTGGHEQ